jgi:Flp pilus assembly protein TadG
VADLRIFPRPEAPYVSKGASKALRVSANLVAEQRGSALLEFAISLPLLVVFVVGIYDFSGAFNEKQKIEQAAQEGAILTGAQPMSDIAPGGTGVTTNPDSLQPVVTAIFNSLAGNGVLTNPNQGTCKPPFAASAQSGLTWTYSITGCSSNPSGTAPGCMNDVSDTLWIVINRAWVSPTASGPVVVGTTVQVSYDYDWRFNSVIQLLFPHSGYSARSCLTETSSVHDQI